MGSEEDLYAKSLLAKDVNLITVDKLDNPLGVKAKIRYTTEAVDAKISSVKDDNGRVKVVFEQPQKAVTPGQAVVFYDDDLVVGGGTIDSVLH